jgi:hypothetical protein
MTFEELRQADDLLKSLLPYNPDLIQVLGYMQRYGSSIILNWGEDDDTWECSWVTSGKRFTSKRRNLIVAIEECVDKALGVVRIK